MINKIYLKKNKLSSGNINNNTNKNTNKNDAIPKYNPDVNIKYNKMMNNRQDNININSISNTNDDLFKNKYSENDVDKRIIDMESHIGLVANAPSETLESEAEKWVIRAENIDKTRGINSVPLGWLGNAVNTVNHEVVESPLTRRIRTLESRLADTDFASESFLQTAATPAGRVTQGCVTEFFFSLWLRCHSHQARRRATSAALESRHELRQPPLPLGGTALAVVAVWWQWAGPQAL